MRKKKYLKPILWIILFCLCFLASGCTSSGKTSGDVTDMVNNTVQMVTTEETTEQTVPAQEETTAETVSLHEEDTAETATGIAPAATQAGIAEAGTYTSKEDVALYLHTYGKLPSNFMTKKEAQALGWTGGGLDSYVYGACIGGDKFGNYEGSLPAESGRQYYECDIDTMNKDSRGAKRIVFSNDGLIYYTEDHYNTFELLYDK